MAIVESLGPDSSYRRLFLDRVPADFDRKHDIAIGPWCFIDAGHHWEEWRDIGFPEAFADGADFAQACKSVGRLVNQLVPQWAERLNRINERSYSPHFWRVIILRWMIEATQFFRSRWNQIERIIAETGDAPIAVTICDLDSTFAAVDTLNFSDLILRPAFGWWLSSLAVKALAPASWRITEVIVAIDAPSCVSPSVPPNCHPGLASRLVRRFVRRLPFDSIPGAGWTKIPLSLFVALLPRRGRGRSHYDFSDTAILTEFSPSFLTSLDTVLRRTLPQSLTCGFAALEAQALAQHYYPGRLLVDTIIPVRDDLRMVIAMAHERGEKLVTSQHGGWMYGVSRGFGWEVTLEMPYHAFISWGWRSMEDAVGNIVPLPAPLLPNKQRQPGDSGQLLLVGTAIALRGLPGQSRPTFRQGMEYLERKVAFFGGLDARLRHAALYRPYLRGIMDIPDHEYVLLRVPDIRLCKENFAKEMKECRLLVLDHAGTTLLTAYAAGIPTLCTWDKDSYPLSRQAQPLFDRLVEVGLLFYDPHEAAQKVKEVWDDVPGWWNSPSVSAARQAFVQEHARSSRWWWAHWMVALTKLALD